MFLSFVLFLVPFIIQWGWVGVPFVTEWQWMTVVVAVICLIGHGLLIRHYRSRLALGLALSSFVGGMIIALAMSSLEILGVVPDQGFAKILPQIVADQSTFITVPVLRVVGFMGFWSWPTTSLVMIILGRRALEAQRSVLPFLRRK